MFSWLKKTKAPFEKPKTLGQRGEEFAQGIYRQKGFNIIGENVYNKQGLRKGEIDFIAKDAARIIFVEVKTRKDRFGKFGTGEESVNLFKQRKILKAVKLYLVQNQEYLKLRPQIDVCVVDYRPVDNSFVCAKIITNAVEDIF